MDHAVRRGLGDAVSPADLAAALSSLAAPDDGLTVKVERLSSDGPRAPHSQSILQSSNRSSSLSPNPHSQKPTLLE